MTSSLVLPDTVWDPAPATVITSEGGDAVNTAIAWLARDRPGCKVQRTATQSVNHLTNTDVQFTAADIYDIGGWHNPASSPENIVVPSGEDGVYDGVVFVDWASDATVTTKRTWLEVNGTIVAGQAGPLPSVAGVVYHTFGFRVPLLGGDVLNVVGLQANSGSAARNITSATLAIDWFREYPS